MKSRKLKKMVVCSAVMLLYSFVGVKYALAYTYPGDGSVNVSSWNINDVNSKRNAWVNTRKDYNPNMIEGKSVVGDFDGDGQSEIASFYDYTNSNTELHILEPDSSGNMTFKSAWKASSFDANCINNKVAAGDFDGDGKDEIAALYDYGNNNSALFILKADGSTDKFNALKVWEGTSFNGSCIKGLTAGDFDGNGMEEIAAVYDYGNNETAVFEFYKKNENTFLAQKSWESTTFSGENVKNKVVAGDYNGDGKDEIAMFYDHGNNNTSIFTLNKGSNGSFVASKTWNSPTFNANMITSKVASTKLGNGEKDKIIAYYDYENNTTGMFEFNVESGNDFKAYRLTTLSSYEADRINGRVYAGKFDGNTVSVAAMYNGEKIEEVSKGQQVVEYAKNFLGVPYVWGGTTPDGFDCSGLTQYVYKHFGVDITRTTYTQVNQGTYVARENLLPGDLIFFDFGEGDGISHVGIYVGNNQYIHAPQTGDVVKISTLGYGYYTARRIFN